MDKDNVIILRLSETDKIRQYLLDGYTVHLQGLGTLTAKTITKFKPVPLKGDEDE